MSTLSLARRRIDIKSLTNPAPPDDDWRRNLSESGLRASLHGDAPAPRKAVWDSSPAGITRDVDEDYDPPADDGGGDAVPVGPMTGPDDYDEPESEGADNESSRSRSPGSGSQSHMRTLAVAIELQFSASLGASCPPWTLGLAPARVGRVPSVRAARSPSASPTQWPLSPSLPPARVLLHQSLSKVSHKKSRGRRVPTANSTIGEGDIVFQAGKDGEKPTRMFACTVDGCGKCFHRGEHLKRHIRSIHTNERPHSCPEHDCHKTFSRHDNLIQHMKTHGRTLPLPIPGASTSHESLDNVPVASTNHPVNYRYYPGPWPT
ncbi:C2H2 zinc finger [Ceratobasidium sp. AG-Ba]|nr:C2H2 zinc finger [Ceratobasidium sp. AG-Ba]